MATEHVMYKGVEYNVELPASNPQKVAAYYNQYLKEEAADMGGMTELDATDRRRIMEEARAAEREDRIAAAVRAIKKADTTDVGDLTPPEDQEEDDVGISQRRTKPVQVLANMSKANTKYVEDANARVLKTSDRDKTVNTLVDKLNKLATQRAGTVHNAFDVNSSDKFHERLADLAYMATGKGTRKNQLAQVYTNHDRFDNGMTPPNDEYVGYTFITRPRLNLSDVNLAVDRVFAPMLTTSNTDAAFGLRCMMDTMYCKENTDRAKACPLIDIRNPFAVLWCNAVRSVSGFDDPSVVTETTSPGYFREEQTYAIGGDEMNTTKDITIGFRDYPGAPVSSSFEYYRRYLTNLGIGLFVQYPCDIDANRLGYTVSIYRFIVDRTWKTITRCAKCTGCFPVHSTIGTAFNKNDGERRISSLDNFSITFKCNHIDYLDSIVLHEFNMLVRRYAGIEKSAKVEAFGYEPQDNFSGIPYVRVGERGNELVFINQAGRANWETSGKGGNITGTGYI